METISVKVNYRGKNIIIGKGIENQNRIVQQLEKRFPEISRFKQQLQFEYDQGARNLQEAYDNAQKAYKKSIKVKVSEGFSVQRTVRIEIPQTEQFIEDALSQSMRQSCSMMKNQNKKPSKIEPEQTQILPHSIPTENKVIQNLLDEFQIDLDVKRQNQQSGVGQEQDQEKEKQGSNQHLKSDRSITFSNKNENAQITNDVLDRELKVQGDQGIQQTSNPIANIQWQQEQIQTKKNDVSETNLLVEQKIQKVEETNHQKLNRINNYVEINEGSLRSDRSIATYSDIIKADLAQQADNKSSTIKESTIQQNKDVSDDQDSIKILGIQINQNEKSSKNKIYSQIKKSEKDQSLIIEQLKKQFNLRIKDLQTKYANLQQKHFDLAAKFQSLSEALIRGQYGVQKVSHKEQLKGKGYERLPQQEPKQNSGPSKYFVQIYQIQSKQQIQVGQKIEPRFKIINTGNARWPQNVFAMQKSSGQYIEVKTLNPGEQIVVSFGQQKAVKVGDNIRKIYNLIYFSKKGEMFSFGRTFGVFVKVVLPEKPRVPFPPNTVLTKYQTKIDNILKKNKLFGKSAKKLAIQMAALGINDQTIDQFEEQILLEIMRQF